MGLNYYSASEQVRNDIVDVIATSTKLMDAVFLGQPRKKFVLRNVSPGGTDIITLSKGIHAGKVNEGIVLRQNDTYFEFSEVDNLCWQGAIQGICATANGKLSIMEE